MNETQNKITLMCDSRRDLTGSREGYDIVTDGHMLLAIPGNTLSPLAASVIPRVMGLIVSDAKVDPYDLATLRSWAGPAMIAPCAACRDGFPECECTCDSCDGSGKCECNCRNEHDCESCNGHGFDQDCGTCGGSGNLPCAVCGRKEEDRLPERDFTGRIAGTLIDRRRLALLLESFAGEFALLGRQNAGMLRITDGSQVAVLLEMHPKSDCTCAFGEVAP